MRKLMLAAPSSGSGKTVLTCALLAAMQARGFTPCAFKCGPDYIDPMFHRAVLGIDSHNLDLFLSDKETVRTLFTHYASGHDFALCEGVMGYYDGVGGTTDQASAWHLADTLSLPVILIVRPKGSSLTLAAQVKGLLDFRTNSHIKALLLNDCSPSLYQSLAPMLTRETGLPVLGYLPNMEQANVESRHLGLKPPGEREALAEHIQIMAQQMKQTVDLTQLLSLCEENDIQTTPVEFPPAQVTIAVAQDEAFSFCYPETLDAFRMAGARLAFFRPLYDQALPKGSSALYLPGGYPERYAKVLSENTAMRSSIQTAVLNGLPTVAECGGFLYLGQSLEDEAGIVFPMVGALSGAGIRTTRLQRFGYAHLKAKEDNLLLRKGESIPMHEFHYWDSSHNGENLLAEKPLTGRSWHCGVCTNTLWAAFPHLYFAGRPALTKRFVQAAIQYQEGTTYVT